MNLLITGGKGQLGQSIRKLSGDYPEFNFIYTDVEDLDITKADEVSHFIVEKKIDAILNCAAYTAVDKAEDQVDLAYLINETGVANLANAAAKNSAILLHISTDYVFSGKGYRPYLPEEPMEPESMYGKSKAAGELAVRESNANACIIRTSWLYSEFGHNFVKTMINLGQSRDELRIVADQIGSPTYAGDLAGAMLDICKAYQKGKIPNGTITMHYANAGCGSWYDLTMAIMELTGIDCRIIPIKTEEYPLPAARPSYSVLNTDLIKETLGETIPYWRDSLKECIRLIVK
jgi:dTDP-4-dehydrorhamnose reductase